MENVTPIRPGPAASSDDRPGQSDHRPSDRNLADRISPRTPQVVFDRRELGALLNIYGRGVASGIWRDYAIDMGRDQALFSIFQRASERPDVQIVKRPELARRQGAYALLGPAGAVLKRGHELANILTLLERKLLKVVDR